MTSRRSRIDTPADARDVSGDFAPQHPVEVRLTDPDAMGHVNNARYLTYVEIARIAYYEQVVRRPLPLGDGNQVLTGAASFARASPSVTIRSAGIPAGRSMRLVKTVR